MPELFANFWFLLFGMITVIVVVVTLAITWSAARQSSAEFAFKTQLLDRGMSVEEIERVMAAPSAPPSPKADGSLDEDAFNEVVSVLGQAGAPASVIEEVLWALRSVDAPIQQLISSAIQHLVGSADSVDGEQILAVVRPLCGPKPETPAPVAAIRDERIMREA